MRPETQARRTRGFAVAWMLVLVAILALASGAAAHDVLFARELATSRAQQQRACLRAELHHQGNKAVDDIGGLDDRRFARLEGPREQPQPVILDMSSLPPCERTTVVPSVTRSTSPETTTAPPV